MSLTPTSPQALYIYTAHIASHFMRIGMLDASAGTAEERQWQRAKEGHSAWRR